MTKKRIGQFDKETGEVLGDGFIAYVVPKRKNGFHQEGWLAMANGALAIFKQMTNVEDFRVLMALLERLDFENLIIANQAELARELDMQRQNVQRAIKRLIAMDALVEGPRIGINRSYRLNPRFGWKGSAKNHAIALSDERRRRMEAANISGVYEGKCAEED